jgi:hypothetical protein
MELFDGKTGGQKSRDRVPLKESYPKKGIISKNQNIKMMQL